MEPLSLRCLFFILLPTVKGEWHAMDMLSRVVHRCRKIHKGLEPAFTCIVQPSFSHIAHALNHCTTTFSTRASLQPVLQPESSTLPLHEPCHETRTYSRSSGTCESHTLQPTPKVVSISFEPLLLQLDTANSVTSTSANNMIGSIREKYRIRYIVNPPDPRDERPCARRFKESILRLYELGPYDPANKEQKAEPAKNGHGQRPDEDLLRRMLAKSATPAGSYLKPVVAPSSEVQEAESSSQSDSQSDLDNPVAAMPPQAPPPVQTTPLPAQTASATDWETKAREGIRKKNANINKNLNRLTWKNKISNNERLILLKDDGYDITDLLVKSTTADQIIDAIYEHQKAKRAAMAAASGGSEKKDEKSVKAVEEAPRSRGSPQKTIEVENENKNTDEHALDDRLVLTQEEGGKATMGQMTIGESKDSPTTIAGGLSAHGKTSRTLKRRRSFEDETNFNGAEGGRANIKKHRNR
jgi:hypothetical protein